MTHRISAVLALGFLAGALAGCPSKVDGGPDAGAWDFDAGNPPARDACSGGCAANQLCDVESRRCVDACGGCPDGARCVKVQEGVYECRETVVSCNGQVCSAGQVACLGGACSCLASARGSDDSCRGQGMWCNGQLCERPGPLAECVLGSTDAPCPTGYRCEELFTDGTGTCVKDCRSSACDVGDVCYGDEVCLPQGVFSGQECNQYVPAPDGGFYTVDGGVSEDCVGANCRRITVPVSNTCLLKDGSGAITDVPGKGSGNCVYAVLRFWDFGFNPIDTCVPPGNALEGQACKLDLSAGAKATQCGTGLQCVPTTTGDTGVCMRLCNANPPAPGFTPEPACGSDEACVNMYRYTDPNDNAVVGVCMKSCDVFDAAKSTCANVGSRPASCVPTSASGESIVTLNGDGVCVPQQTTVGALGAGCAETDPFKGAACGSGQLCTSLSADAAPTCVAVCDLDCAGDDAPARCATEPNARCASGKTCARVTSTLGATMGFCL